MKVTDEMIRKLADLSGLGISNEEMEGIRMDLEKMIRFVKRLEEIDLQAVTPLLQVTDLQNVYRDDEAAGSLTPEQALKNAAVHDGSFFRAPRIFNKNTG